MRHEASPIDRIDSTNFVLPLEVQVIGHGLDDVLAIVKHTLNSDVMDVRVLQTEHLRLLKRTHAALRGGHEHPHTTLAAHGVLSSAAGVATGRAQDVQLFTTSRQFVFKQIAQQLHGHVFKC